MATLEDLETMLEDMDGKIDTLTTKVDADRITYTKCASCNAGGMVGGDPSSCTRCGGTGFMIHGKQIKIEGA